MEIKRKTTSGNERLAFVATFSIIIYKPLIHNYYITTKSWVCKLQFK